MQCLSCPALISYLTCRGKRTTKCNVKLWMQFHTVFKGSIFRWVIVIWLVCTVLMNSPCYPGPMVYGICFCPVSRKEQLKDLKVAGRHHLQLRPVFLTFTSGPRSSPWPPVPHVHARALFVTCISGQCTSGQCTSRAHQAGAPHMRVWPVLVTSTSGPFPSHAFIPPQPSVSHSRALLAPGSVASVFNHLLLEFHSEWGRDRSYSFGSLLLF